MGPPPPPPTEDASDTMDGEGDGILPDSRDPAVIMFVGGACWLLIVLADQDTVNGENEHMMCLFAHVNLGASHREQLCYFPLL